MVAIIGVLAAVAIPAYNGYRNTAAEKSAQAEASEIMKALQACTTVETLTTCYTASVNMTLSKSCATTGATTGTAPGVGCIVNNASTTAACASATVQGVGSKKHHCVGVNPTTGVIDTTNSIAGNYCLTTGVCGT